MNQFNKYLLLGVILVLPLLSSCNKWLEEHPKAVADELYYNTVEEGNAAIAAISKCFRNAFMLNTADYCMFMEGFADYNYARGSWKSNNNYQHLDQTNINRLPALWQNLYRGVRNSNICISRFPNASEMTDSQKNAFIAEARFFRAFFYFHLTRLWNNVPLRTEENMYEWDLSLSSSDKVYDLIIEDLTFAVQNCPEKPVLIGRPYKDAARILLADVYMTRHDFVSAKPLLESIISSKSYSLVSVSKSQDFDNLFGYETAHTTEEIFYGKTSRTGTGNGFHMVMFFSHPSALVNGMKMCGIGGWYGVVLSDQNKWIQDWDDKDLRKGYTYLPFKQVDTFEGIPLNGLTAKFHDPYASGHNSGSCCDYPIYRYADVLIKYAETLNEINNGPDEKALEYLNMIHRRAYGYPSTSPSPVDYVLSDYNTKDKFMELLTKEQCYEFWGEAKRWPFLVRTGQATRYIKEYKHKEINPDYYVFPIPESEFIYNKALDPAKDQNPGY